MAAISAHPAQAMVNNSTNCTKSVINSINRLSTGQNQRILLKQVSSWPWSTKSIVASPFLILNYLLMRVHQLHLVHLRINMHLRSYIIISMAAGPDDSDCDGMSGNIPCSGPLLDKLPELDQKTTTPSLPNSFPESSAHNRSVGAKIHNWGAPLASSSCNDSTLVRGTFYGTSSGTQYKWWLTDLLLPHSGLECVRRACAHR